MIITSLKIPEGYKGLKAAELKKLGRSVYLAGPNGGGKSRVLSYVKEIAESLSVARFDELNRELIRARAARDAAEADLRTVEANPPEHDFKGRAVMRHRSTFNDRESDILRIEDELKKAGTLTDVEGAPSIEMIPLEGGAFTDPLSTPFGRLRGTPDEAASKLNFNAAGTVGVAAVMQLFRQQPEKLAGLIDSVKAFLGEELKPTEEGAPTLFGKPISTANLTQGQLILLTIALTIYFQGSHLDKLVLLLDEPENHLHPSAVVELIERIKKVAPNSQLWIATHSIPLLAHAEPDEIWFAKGGEIRHGGKKAQEVLGSLLGDDQQQEKLASLLARPAQYEAIHFASQCLTNPNIVDTDAADPQMTQIDRSLSVGEPSRQKPKRVLDFGAGYGRLLAVWEDQAIKTGRSVAETWDYYCYNDGRFTTDEVAKACISRLEKNFDNGPNRYASNRYDLAAKIGESSIDAIVMCNTLHEIDPNEWAATFKFLSDLLTSQGELLIVEDHWLPIGEHAHRFGFLVLDESQIKSLFDLQGADEVYQVDRHPDARYKDRLKTHHVPASALKNVSPATIQSCLKSLQHSSKSNANLIREGLRFDHQSARRYAFWTQQHFNATCALEWALTSPAH